MQESSPNNSKIFNKNNFWTHNDNGVWLATTINLSRNIEKYKFPGKLNGQRRKQIVALVSKEILGMSSLNNPSLINAEELSALEKEYLVEHFLSIHGFHEAQAGEAFIVEDTGEFLAIFNMRDHLYLKMIDTRGELENAWNRLVKIETDLGKMVSYSYSPKYGFLIANPANCGTALHCTVFLQLAGLMHLDKIDEVLEKLSDDSLSITGIQGSPTEIIGDVIAVQNNYSLGVTEENIISSLRSFTTKILMEEHAARSKIRHENSPAIKDKVSRAFGILIHSYQVEAVEALNAISLLKLGLEFGWLQGITNVQLNQLFYNSRRAHLLSQFNEKIPQEEITHKRAEFIHKGLADVKLTI